MNNSTTVVQDSGATAIAVLGNDLNADGGPMTVVSVTQPANGTVVITGGGTDLTYQPNSGFCSTTRDTFTYTLTPGGSTATVSITVACFDPSISVGLTATPAAPAINQSFSYDATLTTSRQRAARRRHDDLDRADPTGHELRDDRDLQGFAEFAAGEGVRVSYEKNTAPGVFTLWGSSPNTSTNTTLTHPPPGLGAGEYVTRVRWEFGRANADTFAAIHPQINGQVVNPDHAGGPVTTGTQIQAVMQVNGTYTAGPTNVNASANLTFNPSPPPSGVLADRRSQVSGGRDRLPDRWSSRCRENNPREAAGNHRVGAATTPDEWQIVLFDDQNPPDKRDLVEGKLIQLGMRTAELGINVVFDFGFWSKDERSALRWIAGAVGAHSRVVYLPIDQEEQRRRVTTRL